MQRTVYAARYVLALIALLGLAGIASALGGRPPQDPEGSAALEGANWLVCDFDNSAIRGEFTQSMVYWSEADHIFKVAHDQPQKMLILVFDRETRQAALSEIVGQNEPGSNWTSMQIHAVPAPWYALIMSVSAGGDSKSGAMMMIVSHTRTPSGGFVAMAQFMAPEVFSTPLAATRVGECSATAEAPLSQKIEEARAKWLQAQAPAAEDGEAYRPPNDA